MPAPQVITTSSKVVQVSSSRVSAPVLNPQDPTTTTLVDLPPSVGPSTYADYLKSVIAKGKLALFNKSSFGRAYRIQARDTTGKHETGPCLSFTRYPTLHNIILHLYHNDFLQPTDWLNISLLNKGFLNLILTYKDFKYHPQDITVLTSTSISPTLRYNLQHALLYLALECCLDVPLLLSCLRGEYTGEYRDPISIINTLLYHNCPIDIVNDVQRVFTIGAPASFSAESSADNFQSYLLYGNHLSATRNPEIVEKSIEKEINNAYGIPLPSWLAPFIPNIHLSPLGLLLREGKKPRLIIDHSFEPTPSNTTSLIPTHSHTSSISVNRMHWITTELPLLYGNTMIRHLTRIYNLRISYPTEILYLFDDDIAAAFRHVKYNLFVAGAFSYVANDTLIIPTSQTFGSNSSPSNFECLAQARAWLSQSMPLSTQWHLLDKHKRYLDMVMWGHPKDTDPRCIKTTCIKDDLNLGVLTYSIARCVLRDNPTLAPDTYPTILIHSDNTSACSWATKTVASNNSITKHVTRLACALQINARLGLHVQYIEGGQNIVADAISRLPVLTPFCPLIFKSQLTEVVQAHPCLKNCTDYQLPPNLLSLITALLSPTAEELMIKWKKQGRQLIPDLPFIWSGYGLLDSPSCPHSINLGPPLRTT